MLETVAVILGLIHTAAMLVFVPIWNILSRLNKNISGIGDALGELRLHISEKYSTKDDYYRLERHHEECVRRIHERLDAKDSLCLACQNYKPR
ncbi:hypothetical protein [Limisalsivibrio acetivorans]|uniref:hypothetical protein n=1 Tax=Limisalsivibrio acetivorans TaxID=1304888 RepID=UPI0003B77B58|nr:hypothetical protein [Limisalsivibrio acetivorans]